VERDITQGGAGVTAGSRGFLRSWAEFYFFFGLWCVLSLIEYPESQDRVCVNFRVLFHALR